MTQLAYACMSVVSYQMLIQKETSLPRSNSLLKIGDFHDKLDDMFDI